MTALNIKEILNTEMTSFNRPLKPLVLYGAGALGRIAYNAYKEWGVEILAVCDSNPQLLGTAFHELQVRSIESVMEAHGDFCVSVSVGEKYYEEVKNKLISQLGEDRLYESNVFQMPSEEVHKHYKALIAENETRYLEVAGQLADDESRRVLRGVLLGQLSFEAAYFNEVSSRGQYFNELTKSDSEGCFVDAGAYVGDTLLAFVSFSENHFEKVVSIEPFSACFEALKETKKNALADDARIHLYNKALYSHSTRMGVGSSALSASAKIDEVEAGGQAIETISLDSLSLERVTFIKMDIEGSELAALEGARETILRDRPKLAVCVYHKPLDILEITEFIVKLGLEYKLYLRHHGDKHFGQNCETVLYAL